MEMKSQLRPEKRLHKLSLDLYGFCAVWTMIVSKRGFISTRDTMPHLAGAVKSDCCTAIDSLKRLFTWSTEVFSNDICVENIEWKKMKNCNLLHKSWSAEWWLKLQSLTAHVTIITIDENCMQISFVEETFSLLIF